ncbi:hypothetical protein L195_g047533, partial [Trifolium pratense]
RFYLFHRWFYFMVVLSTRRSPFAAVDGVVRLMGSAILLVFVMLLLLTRDCIGVGVLCWAYPFLTVKTEPCGASLPLSKNYSLLSWCGFDIPIDLAYGVLDLSLCVGVGGIQRCGSMVCAATLGWFRGCHFGCGRYEEVYC